MYNQESTLADNESLMKRNNDTGELIDLKMSKKRNPNTSELKNGLYTKHHIDAWKLLSTQTTHIEYSVATKMSNKVIMITNSLEPLSDDTTLKELAEEFHIGKNQVSKIFDKLFALGVYAKFEVSEYINQDFKHKKYWVFNPYLSYNGTVVDNRSRNLFSDTIYAKIKKVIEDY